MSPYHPDTLRYPSGAITMPNDRLRHALTWNVFKTLEQIAPTAWVRLLVAACTGLPEGYNAAPHVTSVTCWSSLSPAPAATLRRGRRCGIPVSAIIDTDDTVLAFVTPSLAELASTVVSETAEGGLLDLAEATAFVAGTRSAYVCVVLPPEADLVMWTARVKHRSERVRRVLHATGRGPGNLRGMGATTWNALHGLLAEIGASTFISESEQRLALTTAEWMRERLNSTIHWRRLA